MKNQFLLILLLIISSFIAMNAQPQRGNGGTIAGKVFEKNTNTPIEYANIVLYQQSDSAQITGTISNNEGRFELNQVPPGKYYLDVQFIGFGKERIGDLTIGRGSRNIDVGDIYLATTSLNVGDVVVEAARSPITYEIDKKVISVDQFGASLSGNAADVLENVPSVTVDIEGNVSLRGSGSFTVLIDGRPTILDGQDALQQIPAGLIENIEIITNPSAKYDPEGTAGIINIIMKKKRNYGLSGLMNLNAGFNDKYGGEFLAEYKNPAFNTTFGVDYNKRFFPGTSEEENIYQHQGNTSYVNSLGDITRGRISFGLRGSIDFSFGSNNFLSLGGRYGTREGNRNSVLDYQEWTQQSPNRESYTNLNESERSGDFYSLNLNYLKKFNSNGHELSSDFRYHSHNSDEFSTSALYEQTVPIEGKKTTESGPSDELNAKIDYTLPFNKTSKFEAGYQGEIDISEENTGLLELNPETFNYDALPLFSHSVRYERNEQALYSIYSNEINNFGFQAGFRTEYTYRLIELLGETEQFTIDRWDYFPSAHLSYKFSGGQQLMTSYTRRINRPRGWYLEPFETWSDANTVRIGNPALKPEYIDSYELSGQTIIGKASLSSELYYRIENNKIEGIRSVYADNITLRTYDNVGKDYSLGAEFLLNFDLVKNWNLNLMGNLYNYKIEGVLYDEPFSRESFNWRTRMSNVIKIGKTFQLQLNAAYYSPSVSAQGKREGFFRSDLAVKKELFDKQIALTLQIRDLVNTANHEFISEGPDFYSYNYFTRESPMVMLNIRFTFNNFKQERNRGGGDEGGFGEDEM